MVEPEWSSIFDLQVYILNHNYLRGCAAELLTCSVLNSWEVNGIQCIHCSVLPFSTLPPQRCAETKTLCLFSFVAIFHLSLFTI